jgi:hypothetical protein
MLTCWPVLAFDVYDKLNIVIFNPAAVFSLRRKEVRKWSTRLHEFYVEHMVLSLLNNTQPPVTTVLKISYV